ncbi:hypothetical protein MJ585_22715 [Klebsiella pneumoniae]|nr:hypothetical protein MJ585_22715 [Klebsiella pneumoniae]
MQLWLEHLVYCASGGTGESRLFVRKEECASALAPAEAQAYLNELVDGYLLGCRSRCCCRKVWRLA